MLQQKQTNKQTRSKKRKHPNNPQPTKQETKKKQTQNKAKQNKTPGKTEIKTEGWLMQSNGFQCFRVGWTLQLELCHRSLKSIKRIYALQLTFKIRDLLD